MQRLDNSDSYEKIDVPIDYYWEYKKAYNSWGNNLIWSSDNGVTTITTDKKSGLGGNGETFYIKDGQTLGYLAEQVKYAENKEIYLIEDAGGVSLLYALYTGLQSENYTYYHIIQSAILEDNQKAQTLTKDTKLSLTPELEQLFYDDQPSIIVRNNDTTKFPNGYCVVYFPTDVSTIRDVYAVNYSDNNSNPPCMFNALEFAFAPRLQTKIEITSYSLDDFKDLLKSNNNFRETWLSQYQYNGTTVFKGEFIFNDGTKATMEEILGKTADKYVYIDGVKRYLTLEETTYEDLGVNCSLILEPETEQNIIQNHMDNILKTANINKLYEDYNENDGIYIYNLAQSNNIKSQSLIFTNNALNDDYAIYNAIKPIINEPQNSTIIINTNNGEYYILRLPDSANTIYDTNLTNVIGIFQYYSESLNNNLGINDTPVSSNKVIIINHNTTDEINHFGKAANVYITYDLFKGKLRFNDGEYTIEELQKMFPQEE